MLTEGLTDSDELRGTELLGAELRGLMEEAVGRGAVEIVELVPVPLLRAAAAAAAADSFGGVDRNRSSMDVLPVVTFALVAATLVVDTLPPAFETSGGTTLVAVLTSERRTAESVLTLLSTDPEGAVQIDELKACARASSVTGTRFFSEERVGNSIEDDEKECIISVERKEGLMGG